MGTGQLGRVTGAQTKKVSERRSPIGEGREQLVGVRAKNALA